MPTKYLQMLVPMEGQRLQLFTKEEDTLIAEGYERIVVGGRGPYIEIKREDMKLDNLYIPTQEEWRQDSDVAYYIEHRSKDDDHIMIYEQRRTVSYADYKEGFFYISPFDVTSKEYPELAQWRL